MSFRVETDMHKRLRSQNLGVAVCLLLFIVFLAVLSLVKITNTGPVEGYDHAPRASVTEEASE